MDRIFASIFNPITSSFSVPMAIDSISQAADAGANAPATLDALQPYVLPDNTVLYFGSARAGTRIIPRHAIHGRLQPRDGGPPDSHPPRGAVPRP